MTMAIPLENPVFMDFQSLYVSLIKSRVAGGNSERKDSQSHMSIPVVLRPAKGIA